MTTVARYSPSVAPRAWLRWAFAGSESAEEARRANIAQLSHGSRATHATEFENARQAIRTRLARITPGEVLLPAQTCSVLAESIRRAGHEPRFLDADKAIPTPSPAQYAAALGPRTTAVVIAPLYGYLQRDWQPLLDTLGERTLLLDLAQGLGLTLDRPLAARADALVYSFGLGKGIDTGGSLLLTREPLDSAIPRAGAATHLVVLAQALAVRTAEAAHAYRLLLSRMERESEQAKEGEFDPRTLAPAVHLLWRPKLERLQQEFAMAAARAARLAQSPAIREAARDVETYFDAAPLRQVLRLRSAAARDAVMAALTKAGVDCAPAGEPLPPNAHELYPNATAFGATAIRLPFLGRLSDRNFAFVERAMEPALVDLPH